MVEETAKPTDEPKQETKPAADPWTDFAKNFPASESKPISGSTTVKDGAGYPAELVAYSLLDDATSSITTAARNAQARHILLVEDRALIDSEWPYLVVTTQLGSLGEQISEAMALLGARPETEKPAETDTPAEDLSGTAAVLPALQLLGIAPKVAGTIADLVGMFRTNYTMASRSISARGTPLLAQVADSLIDNNFTVSVDSFLTVPRDSPLLTSFRELATRRDELVTGSVDLRVRVAAKTDAIGVVKKDRESTASALLKALADEKPGKNLSDHLRQLDDTLATKQADIARDSGVLAFVDNVLAAVTALATAVLTSPPGGRAPLLSALARENLHLGEAGVSHVLFVSIDSVGADIASPSSQLKDTNYVKYLGGMQVTYLLYAVGKRRIVASGVERRLTQAKLDLETGNLAIGRTSELR